MINRILLKNVLVEEQKRELVWLDDSLEMLQDSLQETIPESDEFFQIMGQFNRCLEYYEDGLEVLEFLSI